MKLRPSYVLSVLACALGAPFGFAQIPYPGNDADHGVTRVAGAFDPYTGNMAFATRDIVVAGAVGRHGLSWSRHATSRTSQTENLFGLAHNWAHGWQWEMVNAGKDTQGRAVISVREPQGWVHRFTETSPGQWWPAPGVQDRVVSKGNTFVVNRLDAGEVRFTRQLTKQGDSFQLEAMVDAEGNAWAFAWQAGRLAQVTEPAGRWLKISYGTLSAPKAAAGTTPSTVITSVAASDGQVVGYTYEFLPSTDYPSLTSVAYPDGTTARYSYVVAKAGGRLLLTSADDPRGDRALRGRTFAYRAENEAAHGQMADVKTKAEGVTIQNLAADTKATRSYAVTQTNGAVIYQTFSPGGNMIEEIDALGFAKKRAYDAADRGFLTSTTDALGNTTSFQNDAGGHVVKTLFPDGSARVVERDSLGRIVAEINELGEARRFIRDAKGRIGIYLFPDGSKEEITFNDFGQMLAKKDRAGAITQNNYNSRGLLTKVIKPLGAAIDIEYDNKDRRVSYTDSRGNTTRYGYNEAGLVTATIFADGNRNETTYNEFGQITKSVDGAGASRTSVYDSFGRKISSFDSLGTETRMQYGAIGKEYALWDRPAKVISPSGRVINTSFDAVGRPVARTFAFGTSEATTSRTIYNAIGRVSSTTDARGKTTQFFYDQRGRRIKTQSSLNHANTVTYDLAGKKVSETDAKGNITRWTYDRMGRELTKTDSLKNVTQHSYNLAGRLASITDPNGNVYRFEYDSAGHQTALIYPDESRETTVYDISGLKRQYINRAGTIQKYEYDNRNREVKSEWSDGSQKVVKAYDESGRMKYEETNTSKISYEFDAAGHVISETQDLSAMVTGGAFDPAPRTVHYTYNRDGQKDSIIYPDGSFIRYAYNARGQITDIVGDGIPPPIASYDYDAAGNATKMPRENDTETIRSYDDENKITSINENGPHRNPLSQLDYEYDEVGNPQAITSKLPADLQSESSPIVMRNTYQYDEMYRVTGATYFQSEASATINSTSAKSMERFTYDLNGNRATSKLSTIYSDLSNISYASNNLNQYVRIGDIIPTYDRNGNLASLRNLNYRYDALNRLVGARSNTTEANFYYDARNRCVARNFNGTVTLNYFDGWKLIEERSKTGAQQARYVHGRRMDEIVVMVNKFGVFYPHHDALGNVTMLTDSKGNLVERYNYSVAGNVSVIDLTGKTQSKSTVDNRWMFTGRELLSDIELYDFRNRVYSSQLGRFLQTDPIKFKAGDSNIYRYCFNQYTRGSDPSGLGWFSDAVDWIVDAGQSFVNAVGENEIRQQEANLAEGEFVYEFTGAYMEVVFNVSTAYADHFWSNASDWQSDLANLGSNALFAGSVAPVFEVGASLSFGLVVSAGAVGCIEIYSLLQAISDQYAE